MCREKSVYSLHRYGGLGSPLRVQGKGKNNYSVTHKFRITPACAGKRITEEKARRICEDHPCVCREKGQKIEDEEARTGSPLRVQGKVLK